jgi:hypothetical protein
MAAPNKLPLDQVIPGMMLAADVCASGGSLLLPAGTTLSKEQIERLAQRGVTTLSIVAPAAEASPDGADSEARRAAERQRVHHLFRRAAADPLTQALLRTVLEFRLEKIR